MSDQLIRALDRAAASDWDGARAALQPPDDLPAVRLLAFIADIERREDDRRRSNATLRHEIGNALAIVQANLEGVIDGVLEPSGARLASMREALASAGALLEGLRQP